MSKKNLRRVPKSREPHIIKPPRTLAERPEVFDSGLFTEEQLDTLHIVERMRWLNQNMHLYFPKED